MKGVMEIRTAVSYSRPFSPRVPLLHQVFIHFTESPQDAINKTLFHFSSKHPSMCFMVLIQGSGSGSHKVVQVTIDPAPEAAVGISKQDEISLPGGFIQSDLPGTHSRERRSGSILITSDPPQPTPFNTKEKQLYVKLLTFSLRASPVTQLRRLAACVCPPHSFS